VNGSEGIVGLEPQTIWQAVSSGQIGAFKSLVLELDD